MTPKPLRDTLWQAVGYTPSAEQLYAHDDPARFKLVAGGIRAGKSYSASKELVYWIARWAAKHSKGTDGGKRKLDGESSLWWIVGPTYELCRPEYLYVAEDLINIGMVKKNSISMARTGPLNIRLPFGTIETKSAEDIVKIAGVAPDGIIVCEVAQLEYEAWQRMFERASQKRAPIWASSTFEGSLGWYPREWNEWQGPNKLGGKSFSIPTWANLAVYPGGRQDPEILLLEASLTPEQFQERCGAVPCPPSTLVFREFDPRKHVKKMTMAKKFAFVCQNDEKKQSFGPDDDILEIELPWDEPVELWIDPGYAGAYAVLAVMWVGDCAFIFDEVYETHKTAREVIETCRAKTWWKRVKYGVMDVAGRQHQGMESHEEIWQAKAGIPISAEYVPVADGIERHRTFLASGPNGLPRLFLSDNCRNTSKEYGLYKYRDDKDGRPTREEPISAHDHAMKCIAYGLIHKVGYVRRPKQSEYLYISPFSDFTAVKKQDKSLPWPLRD